MTCWREAPRSAAHWRPNLTVESTEVAIGRVCALGGELVTGPVDISDGSIGVVRDPQSASFALFAGEVDP